MGELVFGIGREQSCSWPTIQISRKNWDSFMPSLQLSCNSPYHLCVCPMWHHWIADLFVVFHDITVRVGTLLVWSTVYKCAKANGDRIKVTWFIVVSKLDVRRPISRAGSPPGWPDWVLQVGFRLKLSHSKFGVKWLKPEGVPMENVLSFSCACAMPNPLFEVHRRKMSAHALLKMTRDLFRAMSLALRQKCRLRWKK